MLRARLRYFNVDREVQSVLTTSASAGEGKTTVGWNLAVAAARAGSKTLIVETDFHIPRVAERYSLAPLPGLAEVLTHQISLDRAVQSVAIQVGTNGGPQRHLDVIVTGTPPPNPAELMESTEMRKLVLALCEQYDLVVIDAPPIPLIADAIPLITLVSGVIVIGQLGRTTREQATALRDELRSLDAHVLGVVVNRVPKSRRYEYYSPGGGARSKEPQRVAPANAGSSERARAT
jgi:capsular exopolysaccharide synthesis family protein